MEVKASVLEWLLDLNIPDEDLPLSTYRPQGSGGTILLSEDAEAALLNGQVSAGANRGIPGPPRRSTVPPR